MMSAGSLLERATSSSLESPDWAANLDIVDIINGDPGQAKAVVKAVKKRLSDKNPRVQLLVLTVLESLVKNCGAIVHQQVAERVVLQEMTKIVKKKSDKLVREKILELLDSWHEAFGGPKGKYPQYFKAYDELRRAGIEYPGRTPESSVPIFTPPPVQTCSPGQDSGSITSSSDRLDRADVVEPSDMSLADFENVVTGVEILREMLSAVHVGQTGALNDEVIVHLVEQCRINQRRVMQLVNTSSNEEKLRRGLSLNDELQLVLAKHDAIASDMPITAGVASAGHAYDQEEDEDEQHLSRANRFSTRSRTDPPKSSLSQPAEATLLNEPSSGGQSMASDYLTGDVYRTDSFTPSAPPMSQPEYSSHFQSSQVSSLNSDFSCHALPAGSRASSDIAHHQDDSQSFPQPQSSSPKLKEPSTRSPARQENGRFPYFRQNGESVSYVASHSVRQNFSLQEKTPSLPQDDFVVDSTAKNTRSGQSVNLQEKVVLAESTNQNIPPQRAGLSLPPPPGQQMRRQQYFQQLSVGSMAGGMVGRQQKLSS